MHHLVHNVTILVNVFHYYAYRSMDVALTFIVGNQRFLRTVECQAFTLGTLAQLRNIVQTKYHILSRHSDRSTVGRVQYIV